MASDSNLTGGVLQSVRIVFRKLKDLFQRERQPGDTFIRVLFRVVLKSASLLGAKLVNNGILNKVSNYPRFAQFQHQQRQRLGNHFYVIVVPNTLHLLNPCLKLIPSKIRVFLILNGVKRWEAEYIQRNYPNHPVFKLSSFPGSSLSHGTVITLLLKQNETNFGIIDHDLYVFNQKIFEELDFGLNECVIGAFQVENEKAGLIFPTTHFMFFNTPLIRGIMGKYHVDATVYRWIPSRIKPLLAELNLGYRNYLKSYATVFDTFNIIQALAFYEGLSVKFVNHTSDVWHVGGASYIKNSAYLNYIQLKFLEMPVNLKLLPRYDKLLAQKESIQEIIQNHFHDGSLDRKTVYAIELAIKKVGHFVGEKKTDSGVANAFDAYSEVGNGQA